MKGPAVWGKDRLPTCLERDRPLLGLTDQMNTPSEVSCLCAFSALGSKGAVKRENLTVLLTPPVAMDVFTDAQRAL